MCSQCLCEVDYFADEEDELCEECLSDQEEKPLGVSDLDWNLKLVGMSQKDFC